MRAFITGIDGFAGRYLTELLLNNNFKVFGSYLDKSELGDFKDIFTNVELFQCDLTQSNEVLKIFKNNSFNLVFHLAAQSSVHQSFKFPQSTFGVNVIGTVNLLEAIRKHSKIDRILFASSADVYGPVDSQELPITETTPVHPLSPYAVSKVSAELLCQQYVRVYDLPIVITRSFNHTGPGQSTTFVIPEFASQIAKIELKGQNNSIRVGNLKPKRDFLDVRDVVRAYFLLSQKGLPGEIYNIASGSAHSVEDILNQLISLSDAQIEVDVDDAKFRPAETPILFGDYQKLNERTDWRPEISLKQTLDDVLNYWRQAFSK